MSRLIELSRKTSTLLKQNSPFLNPNNGGQFRNSHYMSRLFPKSNSSMQLSSGNSLVANVVRLNDEMLLVDSGIGSPRICLENEVVVVNSNKNKIRFENKVGFLDLIAGETMIRQQILERFFVDIVSGDNVAKERAESRFNDLVGDSADFDIVSAGEPLLVLPRRYRQKRIAMELQKIWKTNSQVKGFYVGRNRSGYAVAIAGYIAFYPYRSSLAGGRMLKDRFIIESIKLKTGSIVVL